MSNPVLVARQLKKTYRSGPQEVTVWQDVDLEVAAGESIAIVGASGSGKTSLLNVLGGLDHADEGDVLVQGQSLLSLSDAERTRVRGQHIGFVYQFHHLLPEFSALENVMMPLLLNGVDRAEAKQRAAESLSRLKLAARIDHKPSELSGGERQRTAIARAIVASPALVLMDEPTGNLDQTTAGEVEAMMQTLREQSNTAFVTVTHDQSLAQRMDACYQLVGGVLTKS